MFSRITELPERLASLPMFNTAVYTPLEIFLFLTGCCLWLPVYMIIIRNTNRNNYVEMPILVACANFAWEFIWSFLFNPDMGRAVAWCYIGWFILDIYIFFRTLQVSAHQMDIPFFRQNFVVFALSLLVFWFLVFYYFEASGLDTPIGAMTAFVDNTFISALYVVSILRASTPADKYSKAVAWMKMIGTGMNTIFLFLHYHSTSVYAGAHVLHVLGVTVFILDSLYIYWLYQRQRTGKPIL
jgi:hypothetical protein